MKTVTMLADSPQDAVRKARQSYGPQAVIKEVRQQSAKGLSRMWRKPKLELLIQIPEPKTAEISPAPSALRMNQKVKLFFRFTRNKSIKPPIKRVLPSHAKIKLSVRNKPTNGAWNPC